MVPEDSVTGTGHTFRVTMSCLPHLALHVCALLWGTQHAIIKSLVVSSALPVVINAIRFTIAAAVTSLASCLVARFFD